MTEAPRKPRRAPTEKQILDAALGLLDAGGREAASIRRIAAAVGVAPSVVYTLFPDHSAVEGALIERLLGTVRTGSQDAFRSRGVRADGSRAGRGEDSRGAGADESRGAGGEESRGAGAEGNRGAGAEESGGAGGGGEAGGGGGDSGDWRGGDWRARVEGVAAGLRERLVVHPGVVPLLLTAPLDGPEARRVGGCLVELLAGSGLDSAGAVRGAYAIVAFVLGEIAMEVADVPRAVIGRGGSERFRWGLRRMLDGLETEAKLH
jgi:AcrR family transcriptional regulator